MTSYLQTEAIKSIGRGLEQVAKAIDNLAHKTGNREPIFILVPSDLKVEDAKKLGETLREAFRGG